MSEIKMQIPFPVDDDGFFRRECPLCIRQFKALVPEDQRQTLAERFLTNHLLEEGLLDAEPDEDEEPPYLVCPYCGQESDRDAWWTQQQLNYLGMYLHNIVADIINKQVVEPLRRESRRNTGGLISISFKAEKMSKVEPWIPPEENDMTLAELPCCEEQIKIADEWTSAFSCPLCGFLHGRGQR